jgi:predicted aspartyl protease
VGEFTARVSVNDGNGGVTRSGDALVDTGATYAVLPRSILRDELGVEPVDEMEFTLADGRLVSLPVGDVYLTVENRTAPSRVVFGEDGQCLLGATTLQVLGLIPDTTNHQLIPAPMLRI